MISPWLRRFFRATELTNVSGTGVVEDRYVRLGQPERCRRFRPDARPPVDHGGGVFRRELDQGQRNAEVRCSGCRVLPARPRVRRMLASISLTVVLPLERSRSHWLSDAARFKAPNWPRA